MQNMQEFTYSVIIQAVAMNYWSVTFVKTSAMSLPVNVIPWQNLWIPGQALSIN